MADFLRRKGFKGVWHYYRQVPAKVAGRLGKTYWDVSLRTAAEAKLRKLASRDDDLIAAVLAELEGAAEKAAKVDAAFRTAEARVADLPQRERAEARAEGGAAAFLADVKDDVRWHNIAANSAAMLDPANLSEGELADRVARLAAESDAAGARTLRDGIRTEVLRRAGVLQELGLKLEEASKLRTDAPGIEAVMADYCAERALPEQTARQYGYAARRFAELHGDVPMSELGRDHLAAYAETAA